GELRRLGDEAALQPGDGGLEGFGQGALDAAVELLMLGIGGMAADPFVMEGGPTRAETAPDRQDRLRNMEGLLMPAQFLARAGDFFLPEGRAMGCRRAGLGRRPIADDGLAGDQAGTI